MGKITTACKTGEKTEGKKKLKDVHSRCRNRRLRGNYCGQIVGTHCASLLTNRVSSRTLNPRRQRAVKRDEIDLVFSSHILHWLRHRSVSLAELYSVRVSRAKIRVRGFPKNRKLFADTRDRGAAKRGWWNTESRAAITGMQKNRFLSRPPETDRPRRAEIDTAEHSNIVFAETLMRKQTFYCHTHRLCVYQPSALRG